MAAYAHFTNGSETAFHVSSGTIVKEKWMDVVYIQLDGDELDLALQILGQASSMRVKTFMGEEAKMIAINWRDW